MSREEQITRLTEIINGFDDEQMRQFITESEQVIKAWAETL